MIEERQDGSLSRTDTNGVVEVASFFNVPLYMELSGIRQKQQAAQVKNNLSLTLYNANVASSQAQINADVLVPAPTQPTYETVDDYGNDSTGPWPTPLTTLNIPDNLLHPIPLNVSGIAQTVNTTPDYQKWTYLMVLAIYKKEFPNAPTPS